MVIDKLRGRRYSGAVSLIVMIVLSCATQILTLLKTSMVAGLFGTSVEMDAYNFANSIVSFLFGFIAAGISTVVIPNYVHKTNRAQTNTFITIIYVSLLIIIGTVILFRYQLIGLFSNRDEEFINIACNVLLILLLANYLLSVSDVTVAYFQCENKYNIPKIISLIAQIFVIICLIVFNNLTIMQYAFVIATGLIINFVIDLLCALKDGWRYKPSFLFGDEETKKLMKLFVPVVISTGIYKLSIMVDTLIASGLETGMITILSYSNMIAMMINTILIGNLMTFCYPKIVKRIKDHNNQTVFWEEVAFFHMVVCLIIAGFIAVGNEGIMLLFQHGKFSIYAANMVFYGTAIYISGQQIDVIRDLIYRYFYAMGDTTTAAQNSVIISLVNIAVSLLLVHIIGFYGIIIGTVVASCVSLTVIITKFKKRIGFEKEFKLIINPILRNNVVLVLTVSIVLFTKYFLAIENDLITIILFGIETIGIYLLCGFIFNKRTLMVIKSL